MDEQMIEQIAIAMVECGIYPRANQVGHSRDAYLRWARAAHSVIAGKVAELERVLDKQGRALASFVNIIEPLTIVTAEGDQVFTDTQTWKRQPTKDEVQAALEAQNEAAAALRSHAQPK